MDKYISVKTCTLYWQVRDIHIENQETEAKQMQKEFCLLFGELYSMKM